MGTIFHKLCRYLLIWVLILIVLIILTIIVYRESFVAVFSNNLAYVISGLVTCLLAIGGIWYILRVIFPF